MNMGMNNTNQEVKKNKIQEFASQIYRPSCKRRSTKQTVELAKYENTNRRHTQNIY